MDSIPNIIMPDILTRSFHFCFSNGSNGAATRIYDARASSYLPRYRVDAARSKFVINQLDSLGSTRKWDLLPSPAKFHPGLAFISGDVARAIVEGYHC